MARFKVSVGTNPNGSGARIEDTESKHELALRGSVHDMAELLFDLKLALRTSTVGQRCLDEVARRRRG